MTISKLKIFLLKIPTDKPVVLDDRLANLNHLMLGDDVPVEVDVEGDFEQGLASRIGLLFQET